MSKWNAVRLINLNYNHNAIRVDDELWDLNGESTLFSLRNGGGKSVLVQMLTAPFVHKKQRSSKERPFASYFTTNKPTFILVEWKLDDQAGYVLTGMMVRRHQATAEEEETGEELDMVNFICEYAGANPYDIRNFPVVTQTAQGRKLKGYKACLDLFQQWKNDRQLKFFAYDMNHSGQSRAYFSKLAEYRIYYKEWEEIISKINLRESGLSELFADCKSERALIEKWFLKKIEAKLNQEENRVEDFQHLMGQYLQQYRENRSKIEKRAVIQRFYEATAPVQSTAIMFQQEVLHGAQLENRIAHLYSSLTDVRQQATEQLEQLEQQQAQINERIQAIRYDAQSWKIYQLEEEQEQKEQERQQLEQQADGLRQTQQQLEREQQLQECARRYAIWCNASQDVQIEENRLEVFQQSEESLQPEREQIGYTLRCHYETALQAVQTQQQQILEALQTLTKEKGQLQSLIQQQRQKKQELYGQEKLLQERLRQYDQQEAQFNRQYQQNLARNLLGAYGPGALEVLLQEEQKQKSQVEVQITAAARQKEELRQQHHQVSRQREDLQIQLGRYTAEVTSRETELQQFQQELAVRQNLAEHIGFSQEALLDTAGMLKAFQQKLEQLQESLRLLRNQRELEQQQYRRLEAGELLELPAELADALHHAGIDYVFGMEWLKRYSVTEAEKLQMVEANPFIPYSLILHSADLQRLQREPLRIATDFPIPIIAREALQPVDGTELSPLFLQEQVGFYVFFDQRLLNSAALSDLLEERRQLLAQLEVQVQQRQEEYQFYQQRADVLKGQRVNQTNYTAVQQVLATAQQQKKAAEQESIVLREQQATLESSVEQLEQKLRQLDSQLLHQQQKCQALEQLIQAYGQNQENRRQLQQIKEQVQHLTQAVTEGEKRQQTLDENRQILLDQQRERQNQMQKVQEQLQQFLQYTVCPLLEKDIEDLHSRYQAITQQIPLQRQEIEQQLQRARKRFEQADEDLLHFSESCGVVLDDYQQITYDRFRVDELQRQKNEQQTLLLQNQDSWQICREALTRLQERSRYLFEQLQEQLGYTVPRPKPEIVVTDFDRALAEQRYAQQQLEQDIAAVAERVRLYQNQLESMEEFSELQVSMPLTDAPKLAEMKQEALSRFRGMLIRDYRANREQCRAAQEQLYQQTDALRRQALYQDDFFQQPLQTLSTLTAVPEDYLTQLTVTIASYQQLLEKLQVDIALLDREREKITALFFQYLREVHRQFGNIDRSSTIRVQERSLKMLKITLPDWDAQEELYQARLQQYLDDLTEQCLKLLDENKTVEERLGARVTTKELYDAVVGISNVQIQLYKIEEQQAYQIHWANVASNSGGEGFLSAFIVLASLLSYMRHQESDLFREREEGKVLLMDNPFAQTNAAHLLVPMQEIAKRANIQLVCLSGLSGDSIYNRFSTIYVLNLVTSSLVCGLEYLHGEQVKGVDTVPQMMTSAYVTVEAAEQMDLFF